MDRRKKILLALLILLILAGALRLAGVSYGLPLQLIADEPQFVLTALGMAQAKTFIIPHQESYYTLLYNPPYIVYLLLFPFFILTSLFGIADITLYSFITARLVSIGLSLFGVLLMYKIARRIFPEQGKKTAFCAAYFLATSLLSIAISATARHWSFALTLIIATLAVLTAASWKISTRFIFALLLAGIAVGVNQAAAVFILIITTIWFIIAEKKTSKEILTKPWFWGGVFVCASFSLLSFFLYSNSLYGVQQESWGFPHSLGGALTVPINFLSPLAQSEPIFVVFAVAGLYALWREKRRMFALCALSITGYSALFYFFYAFQHRHLSLLLPFFALLAAYGASFLWNRMPKPLGTLTVLTLFSVPLLVGARFSFLLLRNDSRAQAREWFEEHIPAETKALTRAYLMRLSMTPESITEKKTLVRDGELSADEYNEYMYPNYAWGRRKFHALNTALIKENDKFYANIQNYACTHGYEYVIAQDTMLTDSFENKQVALLLKGAETLASFGSADSRYSVTDTRFNGPPWLLFQIPEFGPQMGIYRINRGELCRGISALPLTPPARMLFKETTTAKKGEFTVYPFSIMHDTVLHINLTIAEHKKATALLMTARAFRSFSDNKKAEIISQITGAATALPLPPDEYVFVVGSATDDPTYTISILEE